MIKLKAGKKRFQIAQSWLEVRYFEYKLLIEPGISDKKAVSILTGFDEQKIDSFGQSFIDQMKPYLTWMSNPVSIQGIEPTMKIDILTCKLGQLYQLENVSETNNKIDRAIEIYFPDLKTDQMLLGDVLAIANDLYKQLGVYQKRERDELDYKPTNEQIRAGIDKFNQFKRANTIDILAGGDLLKWEEILELDVNSVHLKLKMKRQEGIFNKNYHSIMSEKR